MKITKHAEKRIRQRVGVPKGSVEETAKKALDFGLKHAETAGGLHRYIDALFLSHGVANNVRIYGQKVYLFCRETLITVMPLPTKYFAAAKKCLQRKKKEETTEDVDG